MADVRARIFVLAGPDLARSFDVGERALLGRSGECDVVLHDRSISRKHAVLTCQDGQWFVQDLGSTNGVSKGGKKAERIELSDGDEFALGDLPLRLRTALEEAREDALEFAGAEAAPAAPAPSVSASRAAPPSAPAPAEEDEIEIEEEIEIGGVDEPVAADARDPSVAATAYRAPRAARRTGFLAGDIEQRPLWVRGIVLLVLLVLCAGLCYGAFLAVTTLRSGL